VPKPFSTLLIAWREITCFLQGPHAAPYNAFLPKDFPFFFTSSRKGFFFFFFFFFSLWNGEAAVLLNPFSRHQKMFRTPPSFYANRSPPVPLPQSLLFFYFFALAPFYSSSVFFLSLHPALDPLLEIVSLSGIDWRLFCATFPVFSPTRYRSRSRFYTGFRGSLILKGIPFFDDRVVLRESLSSPLLFLICAIRASRPDGFLFPYCSLNVFGLSTDCGLLPT